MKQRDGIRSVIFTNCFTKYIVHVIHSEVRVNSHDVKYQLLRFEMHFPKIFDLKMMCVNMTELTFFQCVVSAEVATNIIRFTISVSIAEIYMWI
jgi:hypothetical protein